MQPWEVDQDHSSYSELLSKIHSVGCGELSSCLQTFRDLPLSCSLPAHSLPLLVPIFPRSASRSPNAHSRPCAFTFSLGTGLFLPLVQLPQPCVPAFGTAGPGFGESPGDFALSSCCRCGIWYLARDQGSEPNPHKSHVLPGAQRLLLCCRGSVVSHCWRGLQDKALHCVFRRAGHDHDYCSSRHNHLLKRATLLLAPGKPVLRKELGILGVWLDQQHLRAAVSAQTGPGLTCVRPRTGINPPKRPFPQECSMFYFKLIIFSL